MPDESPLAGRVAIVTGAGGVGTSVATTLAARGAAVAVVDVDESAAQRCADEIKAAGGEAVAIAADLRRAAQAQAAVATAEERLGAPRILALCHGVLRTARLLQLSEEDWDDVFDANAKGRFLVSQAVSRRMIAAGAGGVIVDVGSFTGERIAVGRLHYCAGNAVGEALTRAMAVDLGKYGIRVVSIASGPLRTALIGDRANDPARMARFLENIPLRRLGEPVDVAEAVAFLASDEARYWTGGSIALDGGWMAG